MDTEDDVKREFLAGDLEAIDAIERLQELGYDPKEAEALVEQWEENGE